MKVIPVADVDQIFCIVAKYEVISPEAIGFSPVRILVTIRSAIGVICATAEVRMVEICISEAKIACVCIVGMSR